MAALLVLLLAGEESSVTAEESPFVTQKKIEIAVMAIVKGKMKDIVIRPRSLISRRPGRKRLMMGAFVLKSDVYRQPVCHCRCYFLNVDTSLDQTG